MLRASGKHDGEDYALDLVLGQGEGDGGVPHGRLLVRFAEAVLGEDDAELAAVRADLLAAMGEAALADSAAVAGLFNAIDRVADSTGIPLEDWKARSTADFRSALGIDRFHSTQFREPSAAEA